MEDWQKQFIIKNLPELIGMTKFNAKVKAKLQANHILSQDDVKELVSCATNSNQFQPNNYNKIF